MVANREGRQEERPNGGQGDTEGGGTGHQRNVHETDTHPQVSGDGDLVKLATLKKHCLNKGISLKKPGIPTLSGKIRIGNKLTRQNSLIIQMVGEDRKFGWGMIPTMIAMGR